MGRAAWHQSQGHETRAFLPLLAAVPPAVPTPAPARAAGSSAARAASPGPFFWHRGLGDAGHLLLNRPLTPKGLPCVSQLPLSTPNYLLKLKKKLC